MASVTLLKSKESEVGLALRAYGRCLIGLTNPGLAALERLRSALPADASPQARGEIHLLSALSTRLVAAPEATIARLSAAVEMLLDVDPALAGLTELLLLESQISLGRFEEGKRRLVERSARYLPAIADTMHGVLQAARGEYSEALSLLEAAVPQLPESAARWGQLFLAEARLDAGKVDRAIPGLVQLTTGNDYDEVFIRAMAGRALAGTSSAGEAAGLAWRARQFAINVPRYRVWADLAGAIQSVRRGHPDRALTSRAAAELAAGPYRFDEARLISRLSAAWQSRTWTELQPVTARGRELFSRMGLLRRLSQMTSIDGNPAGTSLMLSTAQSLHKSTVGTGGGDDVELGAIFEVNRHIGSSLSMGEVLQRLLESVMKVLKAERGAILRLSPEGAFSCIAAKGVDPAQVKPDGQEITFSAVREAHSTSAPVLASNAQVDPRFRAQASVMAADVRSVVCAPLKTAKATWGFLYLDTRVATHAFREHHRELLGVFCNQAASALENAFAFEELDTLNRTLEDKVRVRTQELASSNKELARSLSELKTTRLALAESQRDALDRELSVARKIQQDIVPGLEPITRPGLAVAGVLEAAMYCGGDFWCAPQLPEGRSLVFLGDVTGHGVGSALIASAAKAAIDTYLHLSPRCELPQLMTVVSDAIFASSAGKLTMTAIAALYDSQRRELTYAGASHPAPVHVANESGLPRLGRLTKTGVHMGSAAGLSFAAETIAVTPGRDRLVLYSDGLLEAKNTSGRPLGAKNLQAFIVDAATLGAAAMRDRLLASAKGYCDGAVPDDDVTVVVLEFTHV